jgi:hypothetical protein
MNISLFETEPPAPLSKDILGAGTAVLAGFALDAEAKLLSSLKDVIEQSPFSQYGDTGWILHVGCHVELWLARAGH